MILPNFRKACPTDIIHIWNIILEAKAEMERENRSQWDEYYPLISTIENDIEKEFGYVLHHDGKVVAYGAISFEGESAYKSIDGTWLSDNPYIVLHRLAVADEFKGIGIAKVFFKQAENLAIGQGVHSFKVDTNFDNKRMLKILNKLGFKHCGVVKYPKGNRLAFEKIL